MKQLEAFILDCGLELSWQEISRGEGMTRQKQPCRPWELRKTCMGLLLFSLAVPSLSESRAFVLAFSGSSNYGLRVPTTGLLAETHFTAGRLGIRPSADIFRIKKRTQSYGHSYGVSLPLEVRLWRSHYARAGVRYSSYETGQWSNTATRAFYGYCYERLSRLCLTHSPSADYGTVQDDSSVSLSWRYDQDRWSFLFKAGESRFTQQTTKKARGLFVGLGRVWG